MTIPKIANASGIDSPSWDRVCECTPATKWQGSLWELSPWQHKLFLVLCCHSPTQHLQTDGISLPACHHLLYLFLFLSCMLLLAQHYSTARPAACPPAVINQGWPEPRSLCPQHTLNPISLLHWFLFYFNLFFKIRGYLFIFNAKAVPAISVWSVMRNSTDSLKMWLGTQPGPLVTTGIIISSVVILPAYLSLLWKFSSCDYPCCGKASCLKTQTCRPSPGMY